MGRYPNGSCRACKMSGTRTHRSRLPAESRSAINRQNAIRHWGGHMSAYDAQLEEEQHQEEQAHTPERLVWLAVIASAVQEHRLLGSASNGSAERFLFGDDSALTVIAPLIGLDVDEIREAARR